MIHNQSRIGPGLSASNGIAPRSTVGVATPGNPWFHVGVEAAVPNAPAVLGVSTALASSGASLDPAALILPNAQFGLFSTDAGE